MAAWNSLQLNTKNRMRDLFNIVLIGSRGSQQNVENFVKNINTEPAKKMNKKIATELKDRYCKRKQQW